MDSIRLVLLSFFASIGYGLVFRIERKYLLWAGFGGALIRSFYIMLSGLSGHSVLNVTLAAVLASFYAEVMAVRQKTPATIFLYPSIIPLLPGRLLCNTMVGFVSGDMGMLAANAERCIVSLAGVSVGFVIVSTILYYKRIYYIGKEFVGSVFHHWQK